MNNLGRNPEEHEVVTASNIQKLELLAQLYRIASFKGGEPHRDDELDLRLGSHGHAFGPMGELTCSVVNTFDFEGENLFRNQDRVQVASMRLAGHSYHFFAVFDRDIFEENPYEYEPLAEALYNLTLPLKDFSAKPDVSSDLESIVGFTPRFETQHLEIYKDLSSELSLEDSAGVPEYDAFIRRLVNAINAGDIDEVRELEKNKPEPPERDVDLEELKNLEISLSNEVQATEVQNLLKVLSEEYYAVSTSSYPE